MSEKFFYFLINSYKYEYDERQTMLSKVFKIRIFQLINIYWRKPTSRLKKYLKSTIQIHEDKYDYTLNQIIILFPKSLGKSLEFVTL